MVKTLRKELLREIRNSRTRFLSILIMVALGVMFLVGLRSAAPDMRNTADGYFDDARFYDVQILSTLGLTGEDVTALSEVPGVEQAVGGWSLDATLSLEDRTTVVKAISLCENVNLPLVRSGRLPETEGEIALDQRLLDALKLEPGDTVLLEPGQSDALTCQEFTVTGAVDSPLYISLDRGTSTLGDGSVSGFVLLTPEAFALDYFTDIQITAQGGRELDAYGQDYKDLISALTDRLEPAAEDRAALRYEALVSDGERELADAQSQLDQARADAEAEFAQAQAELDQARQDLDDSRENLSQADLAVAYGLMTREEADALAEALAQGEQEYQAGVDALEQARADAETEFAGAQAEIDDGRAALADIKTPEVYVLDRDTNYGFVSYDQNAERMENLARVFPIIFFVVAALVCLTTMTRMVEEERTQIGSIKAMGYGTGAIAWKFLVYGALAAISGSLLGCAVGTTLIPWVIFTSYNIMYTLPALELRIYWLLCIVASLAGVLCTAGATLWAMLSTARLSPAALMRPKAPRAGKRILLERIGPVWKRMTFSMKVSARNLFRYKKRLWMTVIGVAGCTALLIAGLGLRSSIFNIIDIQFGELYRYDVRVSVDTDVPGGAQAVEALLSRWDNVDSYAPAYTRSVTFQKGSLSAEGYLMSARDPAALSGQIAFRDMATHEPVEITEEGTVIDVKLAERLDLKPGDALTIDCGRRITVPVTAIREHYVYHYALMTAGAYTALTGEDPAPNEYFITTRDHSEAAVSALCQALLELDAVQSAGNLKTTAKSFRETMEVVDAAVGIIILSAAALALVVLYNLTNINITERIRELATIKVLGFYDGEVAMYIYRENIILTLAGIALGQLFGKFLCTWLVRTIEMDSIMFGRRAMTRDYLLSILLSLCFAVLVNVLMYFRMKKIDMVQSLKSVE